MPKPPETDTPFISVIMPVHNGLGLLEEAVDSVRAQNFGDWELLVVDDGSDDGSPEVIAQLADAEPRIRLLRLPENRGPGAARNLGLEQARGEFVSYLDCDDRYHPLYLEHVAHCREKGDVLVFCYDIRSARGPQQSEHVYTWNPVVAKNDLFRSNLATPLGVAHRREPARRVGGFNELLWRDEDWDLWRRLARAGGRFAYLPLKSGWYQVRQASLSRRPRTTRYQRRRIEANRRSSRPLYETDATRLESRRVRKIALASPHCLLDTSPAAVTLTEVLTWLTQIGFACRVFCGSWLTSQTYNDVRALLDQQNVAYTADRATEIRVLRATVNDLPIHLFADVTTCRRWSSRLGAQPFLEALDQCIAAERPDVLLTYGREPATKAVITAAKAYDIPTVCWLPEFTHLDVWFFHKVDYTVVASEVLQRRYWNELGIATHVLPTPASTGDRPQDYEELATCYREFFENLAPQPGPPFVPSPPPGTKEVRH